MKRIGFLMGWLLLSGAAPASALELVFEAGSEAAFAQPHDIVLSPDRRLLYVSDNNHHRVAVLDAKTLEIVGTFGEGELNAPHDVVFQAPGRLLVADTGNDRIAIYAASDGASATLQGELSGAVSRPEGVAVHPGGRVYATGAASGDIEAFENGESVAHAGGLSSPHDVAVDADGDLWIADAGNDRLVEMDADLNVKRVVAGREYRFNGPRYLDFDTSGRLYVADKYSNQIKVLSPDLRLVHVLGSERAAQGPGVFDRPEGVAIWKDQVWFSDTYNDRIVRYRIRN